MSVIVTLRISGDPKAVERMAQEDQVTMERIMERAKSHGLIAHRFYGSEDKIMVIDEWPDAESFHRFFEALAPEIEPMMEQVTTSEPEITFWRKLESHDEVGWEG